MPELVSSNVEAPAETVSRVLSRLKELYLASAEDRTDEERISEGMSDQIIGETTKRALQALIVSETEKLRVTAREERWDSETLDAHIVAMKQNLTAEIFREHWFESTLSKADHPIHAAKYGTSMFRYDLRMLMTENISSDRIDEFAWIMLDGNGLRSFKDCTSHEETTHYLQGVVRILVNEDSPARKFLTENGITVIPMATGGDEFEFYLRGKGTISQNTIDVAVRLFQQEISKSAELRAMLDFDDEGVLKKYGMPSSAERKEFENLDPDDRRARLAQIRATLPDAFLPGFAGGGALLSEGILRAVERDDLDLMGDEETFHTLREKILQATIELAEMRQKKNKEDELKILEKENPKRFEFRLRNKESRDLQRKNDVLQRTLDETRSQMEKLLQARGIDELEDASEAQEENNGNDANDDVADPLELPVHWDAVEDQRNDKQDDEWSESTHEDEGEELRIYH